MSDVVASSSKMNTKTKVSQSFQYELLGCGVFESDKEIKSSRLPTTKQTLLCFLAHFETVSIREAANITANIIKDYYDRARIPSIALNKIAEAVLNLHKDLADVKKIQVKDRNNPVPKKRIEAYKNALQKTFKVWPRNALEKIEKEEDRKFLISMNTDRKASMLGTDESLSKSELKDEKRRDEEMRRIDK